MPTTTGDNCVITEGTGTSIATDYVTIDGAAAHVQRVKPAWGAAGSALDVSAATPLPVSTTSANTGVGDGRKVTVTAGTALALASSTTCKQVIITAETDNTGYVVIGGSTVVAALATRRGTPLNPGDSVAIEIRDRSKVYLDSIVSGDGVTFTYFT